MENNIQFRIAALLGISAFLFPEQAPWSLLPTLLVTIAAVRGASGWSRLIALLVCTSLFVGVTGGVLSASFVTAAVAAVAIAPNNRLLALMILGLQTSYAASIEAITANNLFAWHLEAAAPALLSGLLLLAVQPRRSWWCNVLALSPLPLVWSTQQIGLSPYGLLVVAGLPSMALAFLTPRDERSALNGVPAWVLSGVVALGVVGWVMTPPRMPDTYYVLLLGEMASPEARFFRNYQEVLKFAGLSAKVIEAAEEIPAGSLVLLPWLTAPEKRAGAPTFERLRELAIERGWLVVLVGEHTNMGGVATRVKCRGHSLNALF